MINYVEIPHVQKSLEVRVRNLRPSEYVLIPNSVEEDRYDIYWSDGNNVGSCLKGVGERSSVKINSLPWGSLIIMPYTDIRHIHKASRYVLTVDIPEHYKRTSHNTLILPQELD